MGDYVRSPATRIHMAHSVKLIVSTSVADSPATMFYFTFGKASSRSALGSLSDLNF